MVKSIIRSPRESKKPSSDTSKRFLVLGGLVLFLAFPVVAIALVAIAIGVFFIIYLPALVLDLLSYGPRYVAEDWRKISAKEKDLDGG